jgi:hypothetical protein
MSTILKTVKKCDRCGGNFEADVKPEDCEIVDGKYLIRRPMPYICIALNDGEEVIEFTDLCSKCMSAVNTAVGKMRPYKRKKPTRRSAQTSFFDNELEDKKAKTKTKAKTKNKGKKSNKK